MKLKKIKTLFYILFSLTFIAILVLIGCVSFYHPIIGCWSIGALGIESKIQFNADKTFYAESFLASFSGKWEAINSSSVKITYYNSFSGKTESSVIIYDPDTQTIYFLNSPNTRLSRGCR